MDNYIKLCIEPLKKWSAETYDDLRAIYLHMSDGDVLRVKEIEKTTNHDVKAVEYFIKEAFQKLNLSECLEFVHFGLTSQDINNTAIPLSIKEALNEIYFTEISQFSVYMSPPILVTLQSPAFPLECSSYSTMKCQKPVPDNR